MGFEGADDAGVVEFAPDRALVQTVDFFTPIVDDPFLFGAIAATNALSDVYAMNGDPLCAMNLVCFPDQKLPVEVLRAILAGGMSKLREAGVILVGGHSVRDDEPKFGLSVTGTVHPQRIWRNRGALPGDVLVLTKAIGTGVLTTARKRGAIEEEALAEAIAGMQILNRAARDAGREVEIHACTDITGNGLGGHAWEMAHGSGVRLRLRFSAIPLLNGALAAAEGGFCPGGTKANARYVDALEIADADPVISALVLDPQTSGGLLFAVAERDADRLVAGLRSRGLLGAAIGAAEAGAASLVVDR